jgi:predicted HicB family RNase H-like nuclease
VTVSKAQKVATAKYEAKVYDKILLRLPRGKKETIQAHAEAHSESVNGFINRAIDEAIERDESAPAASEGHL